MKKEFNVSDEYAKERDQKDENRVFLIGMAAMVVAAVLDWELFQWIYTGIHPLH